MAQGYYHALAQDGVPSAVDKIIQFADPVDAPTFPNVLIFMAVIFVAAVMIGVAVVYVLEARDKSFRTVRQLESNTGVQVLGITVQAQKDRLRFARLRSNVPVSLQTLNQPNSTLSETVRLVRSAISASQPAHAPKVLMVTSAVPGEGKTTFAMM